VASPVVTPGLLQLAWTFCWLSCVAIGGGLGVLPEMQRQVVTVHGWVTAREFVDGYTLSQLTPGPNILITVFVGYRVYGIPGAVVAGLATFLPTAVLTAVVARHWASLRERPWARAAEQALTPLGLGLMAAGVYTLARGAINDAATAAIAAAAALILAATTLPPILVVLAGGLVGWLAGF
jgi:chromate transporter